jgi:endonuclease/exonuclease/phosphatase family metal-dependent hydrolase
MFGGLWVVLFVSSEDISMNYVRFVVEKCHARQQGQALSQQANDTCQPKLHLHDSFRLWLLCSEGSIYKRLTSLTSPSQCIALSERRTAKSAEVSLNLGQEVAVFNFHFMCLFSRRRWIAQESLNKWSNFSLRETKRRLRLQLTNKSVCPPGEDAKHAMRRL